MEDETLFEYRDNCCVTDGSERCSRPGFIQSCSAWLKRPLCRMHHARVIRHGSPGGVESRWRAPSRKRDRRGKDLHNRLSMWVKKYGDEFRIRKITLPIAPIRIKTAWIAQHKQADGPRQGAHLEAQHDNTVRAWQERGWVQLFPLDEGNTYKVSVMMRYTQDGELYG